MRLRPKSRGQALVEFAVVLPVFLVALIGIFDFGRVIWARSSLENAAREGARYAIVHGDSKTQTCPTGPAEGRWLSLSAGPVAPDTWTTCPNPSCPTANRTGDTCSNFPAAGSPTYNFRQGIYNAALKFAIAGGSNPSVAACYGASCSGNTDTVSATTRLTPVTVTVSSTINLVVPSLLRMGSFTVNATSTMIVSN